jgi:hypothetical protein
MENKSRWVALFLAARLVTFMAYPTDSLMGYGDFNHFFQLAALPGWPFFQYWVEFPPIFPFLSTLVYNLAGGQQHVYVYLFLMILTAADTGNLVLFSHIVDRNYSAGAAVLRKLTYLVVLIALPYCWWYFDPLAVFCMMLGMNLVLENKIGRAGIVFGIGFLIKLFPIIGILVGWKRLKLSGLLRVAIISLILGGIGFGAIWLASPAYGRASILSQSGKGSWETIWALIDGNFQTGAMAPENERMDLSSVGHNMALNPPKIPPVLTLVVFGVIGLWALSRLKITTELQSIQVLCFTWGLFLLWSPGFSPQWILYLIPLILLSLPEREGFLFTIILTLICLAEWPMFLTRALFWTLLITVPVRFILIAGMSARVYQLLRHPQVEIG